MFLVRLNLPKFGLFNAASNMPSEHNLQLQQAQLGLVRGALAETSAKGAFLPSLNASSSYGVNIGQRIDPFTNQFASDAVASSNYGMSSGLTLFNGFQNHLNLRRARVDLNWPWPMWTLPRTPWH